MHYTSYQSWRHLTPFCQQLPDFFKPWMLLNLQVALAQLANHLKGAVGQLDVQIHPAGAHQGRVQLLWVVAGEDEDVLRCTCGPAAAALQRLGNVHALTSQTLQVCMQMYAGCKHMYVSTTCLETADCPCIQAVWHQTHSLAQARAVHDAVLGCVVITHLAGT